MSKVAEIVKRIREAQPAKKVLPDNGPKGLPKPQDNRTNTDPDYPGLHEPQDPGFTTAQIVAGTGHGPAIGYEHQLYGQ